MTTNKELWEESLRKLIESYGVDFNSTELHNGMKYKIISGEKHDVEGLVNELLEQGWILHGTMSFQGIDAEWSRYAQAMIKVEEKDSK